MIGKFPRNRRDAAQIDPDFQPSRSPSILVLMSLVMNQRLRISSRININNGYRRIRFERCQKLMSCGAKSLRQAPHAASTAEHSLTLRNPARRIVGRSDLPPEKGWKTRSAAKKIREMIQR
jgi:hypothetical protein